MVDDDRVRCYPLPPRRTIVIGRSSSTDLQLDHPEVSRRHIQLSLGRRIRIQDLDSRNGVAIDGAPIPPRTPVAIALGQALALGAITLVVDRAAAPASHPTIVIDARAHEARCGGARVALAKRPVVRRLIYELAAGGPRAKEALVAAVWNLGYHPLRHDNVLRVTVHQARALLAPLGLAIEFLPDAGYRLVVPPRGELRLHR